MTEMVTLNTVQPARVNSVDIFTKSPLQPPEEASALAPVESQVKATISDQGKVLLNQSQSSAIAAEDFITMSAAAEQELSFSERLELSKKALAGITKTVEEITKKLDAYHTQQTGVTDVLSLGMAERQDPAEPADSWQAGLLSEMQAMLEGLLQSFADRISAEPQNEEQLTQLEQGLSDFSVLAEVLSASLNSHQIEQNSESGDLSQFSTGNNLLEGTLFNREKGIEYDGIALEAGLREALKAINQLMEANISPSQVGQMMGKIGERAEVLEQSSTEESSAESEIDLKCFQGELGRLYGKYEVPPLDRTIPLSDEVRQKIVNNQTKLDKAVVDELVEGDPEDKEDKVQHVRDVSNRYMEGLDTEATQQQLATRDYKIVDVMASNSDLEGLDAEAAQQQLAIQGYKTVDVMA